MNIQTPVLIIDMLQLRTNAEILKSVSDATGCSILLALKGYATFSTFNTIAPYLSGVTASSLYETRLGSEEFKKEVHCYFPAFSDEDIEAVIPLSTHLIFNSCSQWHRYKNRLAATDISCGLRINHQHSEVTTNLYNPCAPYSRLGITLQELQKADFDGIEGLHFHSLCESDVDSLLRTLEHFEKDFAPYLHKVRWVNFGGGHHITRADYDVSKLISCIDTFQKKYDVHVIVEPSEAVALNAGVLETTVLDIVHNEMDIALLNTSAACHMPDVLEMPYRPPVLQEVPPSSSTHPYRLAGISCLAGDIMGDYHFEKPLSVGDTITFKDMAIYTTVKSNTFNGIKLPSLALRHENGDLEVITECSYESFKKRLS